MQIAICDGEKLCEKQSFMKEIADELVVLSQSRVWVLIIPTPSNMTVDLTSTVIFKEFYAIRVGGNSIFRHFGWRKALIAMCRLPWEQTWRISTVRFHLTMEMYISPSEMAKKSIWHWLYRHFRWRKMKNLRLFVLFLYIFWNNTTFVNSKINS